jgi:hypothetical protein
VVGPFWPPERRLVEHFADLPFPFREIDTPKFEMTAHWNLNHLLGYLQTWSSTQRFIAAKGSDPLEPIRKDLSAAWADGHQMRYIVWPLTLRVGVNTQGAAVSSRATIKTSNAQHRIQDGCKNA